MYRKFDRHGHPMSHQDWSAALENRDQCMVARTKILDAANPDQWFDVSTVWLGDDPGWQPGFGVPMIFETMVFDATGDEVGSDEWAAEVLAREGHVQTVVGVASTLVDPVVMDVKVGPVW